MSRGFDLLSPFYDSMAHLIFGSAIGASQICHLLDAPHGSSILAVGGGTGAALLPLVNARPDLQIDFLEKSQGMAKRAQKRFTTRPNVRIISQDFYSFQPSKKYDFILMPFFLDMFAGRKLENSAIRVAQLSAETSKLVVAEFNKPARHWGWNSLLLDAMYAFFRIVCRIEARGLPDWRQVYERSGWSLTQQRVFFHGAIGSFVFERR